MPIQNNSKCGVTETGGASVVAGQREAPTTYALIPMTPTEYQQSIIDMFDGMQPAIGESTLIAMLYLRDVDAAEIVERLSNKN